MALNYSDERRSFLKTAVFFSGAAACLPVAEKTMASAKPSRQPPEKADQGYRETEHISKYYQTARN
ncbi:MAG: hypothetical protein M8357_10210 [Desulfobulbaceae bacterium]|nr:hypothetical protein [Desulfobulbaceae bacterium]